MAANPYMNPYGAGSYANPYAYNGNMYTTQQSRMNPQEQMNPYNSMYGQAAAQNPTAPPPTPQSPIMVVQSEAEARSYPPDLSGTAQIFVNKNAEQIYAKQFNTNTALVDFEIYAKVQPEAPAQEAKSEPVQEPPKYATIDDISTANQHINTLWGEINSLKEELNNVQYGKHGSDVNGSIPYGAADNAVSKSNGTGSGTSKPKRTNTKSNADAGDAKQSDAAESNG